MRLAWLAALLCLAAAPAAAGDVIVTVAGVRNDRGAILAYLFRPGDYLDRSKAVASARVPARRGSVVVRFHGVEAGTYAVSLIHDENGNGDMDYTLLHMPREGFGFSNDPPFFPDPPTGKNAAFGVGDAAVTLTIRMIYL